MPAVLVAFISAFLTWFGGFPASLIEYAHVGPGTVAVADHVMGGYQMDRTVNALGKRRYGPDTSADAGHYAGWDRFED